MSGADPGNGGGGGEGETQTGTFVVKAGLAQMLKGGIIMDVVNVEQARIAEEAGACAVMALEKVPADIRKDGGVARMADPKARLSVCMCIIDLNGKVWPTSSFVYVLGIGKKPPFPGLG